MLCCSVSSVSVFLHFCFYNLGILISSFQAARSIKFLWTLPPKMNVDGWVDSKSLQVAHDTGNVTANESRKTSEKPAVCWFCRYPIDCDVPPGTSSVSSSLTVGHHHWNHCLQTASWSPQHHTQRLYINVAYLHTDLHRQIHCISCIN